LIVIPDLSSRNFAPALGLVPWEAKYPDPGPQVVTPPPAP
jgi:hypothetical protein